MSTPIPTSQSLDDYQKHLADNIQFLKNSAIAYDGGFTSEAKRIATAIRVLLHNTTNSHALLVLLGKLSTTQFFDSAYELNKENQLSYSGLVNIGIGPSARFIPLLDNSHVSGKFVDFNTWWNATIFVDGTKQTFTRRSLILSVANKDGGAHVDPKLDQAYADLSRGNALGWISVSQSGSEPILGVELAAIRQIGHEILKTLDPSYSYTFDYFQNASGMIVGDMSLLIGDAADARAKELADANKHVSLPQNNLMDLQRQAQAAFLKIHGKVGRNQACPCKSGQKYKKCHGNLM